MIELKKELVLVTIFLSRNYASLSKNRKALSNIKVLKIRFQLTLTFMEMAFRQIYTSRYLQPVIHVLFWILVIISPYLFRNPNTWSGFSSWHYKLMINNTILAGFFYLNAYFLYPVLYKRKQIFLYIISLITLVILVMFLSRFIDGQLALLRSPDMSHLRPGRHSISVALVTSIYGLFMISTGAKLLAASYDYPDKGFD